MDSETDSKLKDNGNCEAVDAKLTVTDTVESEGTVVKTEQLPVGLSPSPATKGRGLKKWRRIHRESGKETNNNFDSNRKRGMIASHVGRKQSEGSSSSTNAVSTVLGNALDHNFVYGDLSSRKGPGPDFASRADSDNSEDRNSRSSTAASAPRVNREVPVVGTGFNLSGKSSGVVGQGSDQQQDKGRNATKKHRGFKIKKENSISSVESDSRSSNFVFLQAANSVTSNGRRNGRPGNYDEEDSDDARNGDALNYVSHEDLAGENSWEVKEEKVDDHVGSRDPDALVDSIIPLQLAQEALEREVRKLKDVGKEDIVSSDDWVKPVGFEPNDAHLQSKLEEAFIQLELKNTKISELESTLSCTKIKKEYEELLTRRIAAEVEYLVISKEIQNLKADHIGRINLAEEQKNVSAAEPEEEEDAKKMESRVWRYVCCSIVQSVLLLVVLYIFVLKFSSKTVEVIPT